MEVDVLMLCTSDQQHNDGNILATIEGELIDDETMSELANTDESRADDGDVCQCDNQVTSLNERMLMPDDNWSGGVAPRTDIQPFDEGSARFSDVCDVPAGISHTTQSDVVESQEEESFSFSNSAAVDRQNFTDCAVDACLDDSVSAVDCVVGNASYNECDPSEPAGDASNLTCFVTEHDNHHIETVSDTRSLNGDHLETAGVICADMTSLVSVIDNYAVVDSSNVISDVNSTLIVNVPDTDTESDSGVTASCFIDEVLVDDTQQTSGLPDEAAEAISIEAKKKGFRVRFHEDHVTGYHDPPTPWREVTLCSTPELLAAYRESCKQMGVKPLNKLVQQLEAISNFEERNELLSLKGETIDGRVCETLEEIFRRVRFRCIDLEATSLDEETAVTVFDLLDYYESCERLNISYNKNLGIRGWQACARFIKKTACLEMLEARGCSFNDPAMTMIGRSLRLGSYLRILHLENSFLSGRPLMLLVAAVKFNETLKDLFVADNKLTPSDGVQLGSLLKTNHTLALLDLRNNLLQDVGLAHICDGASEQGARSGLNTLVVWNNQITYESMMALGRALMAMRSLETINLGHNNITNEGIHRLKDGLLQNRSLLRIGLQSAKLSCEGAVALAEFIAETVKLIRLDLRGNYIRTGGLMALMLSLKVNQSVTRIDLDGEPKKEAGIRDYAEQQRRLLSEIATFSARNLAILAGLSPSQNVMSNSYSAVNTSVPISERDSQPLDASSTAANTAESNSANTSTSYQRPSLSLSHSVARSETLESPAYVPSDFSLLPNDVTEMPALEVIGLDKQQVVADAEPKNVMQISSNADHSHGLMASISIETETSAVTSVSSYEKLMPAQPASIGKTSKFAASVRRKFTVSKTVLPSTAAPPVVVFSKLASEVANPCEVQNVDDVGHVHIVNKGSSNVNVGDKLPVGDVSTSPSGVDVSATLQPVADVPTSTKTLESSVITRAGEPEPRADEVTAVSRLQQDMSEHSSELPTSTEVQSIVCDRDDDDEISNDNCDEGTDEAGETCSSSSVQQPEVDTTTVNCAASEQAAAETSSLACKFGCQINVGVTAPDRDAAELHEINSSVNNKSGMVQVLQDGCPAAVNDVSFDCIANECDNELDSVQCTSDELPSNDTSDAVLAAQVSHSTVERTVAHLPVEAPLSLSDKQDAIQQNSECDNISQISESMPTVATTQDQIDD